MAKRTFIHIPKTWWGAVVSALWDKVKRYGHNIRSPHWVRYHENNPNKEEKVVTVLRNPHDRVVSAYFYLKNHAKNDGDTADRKEYIEPFDNFNDFIINWLERAHKEQSHFIPQFYYIWRDLLKHVNRVLSFDCLAEDTKRFALEEFGLEDVTVPVKNKSKHDYYLGYYTPETISIVSDIYETDINMINMINTINTTLSPDESLWSIIS